MLLYLQQYGVVWMTPDDFFNDVLILFCHGPPAPPFRETEPQYQPRVEAAIGDSCVM